MTRCDYCGHENPEADHRCNRCGRRLDTVRPSASRTSPVRMHAPEAPEEMDASQPVSKRPVQRPLFSTHVVRLEDVDPSVRPRRRRTATVRKPRSKRIASVAQQSFEFIDLDELTLQNAAAQPAEPAPVRVEPARNCDYEVGGFAQRITACAVDCSLVLLAMGIVLGVFRYWVGELAMSGTIVGVYAAAFVAIAAFYRLLWCLGNGDSPGMRCCGLRLVRLEGHPPTTEQRLVRVLAGCLSAGALGLGLFWALTDPERLTWHDHISKTFPTPRGRR